jgi:tRNA-specific 2-thiouridylase
MTHALGLCSGGLDSLLAIRVVQEMGIEVTALNCVIGFEAPALRQRKENFDSQPQAPAGLALINVQNEVLDLRAEFLQVLARPIHGFGVNLNPCIDCKILMLSRAKTRMQQLKAAFVFTGEVLDQRPMSQRRQILEVIAKESGLGDYLVRPLSGVHFPPTWPERAGLLRREQLLDLHGRGRTRQMELAAKFDVRSYPTPAGGCLLTDPGYTLRARDLRDRRPSKLLRLDDPLLLLIGRHYVLPKESKAVISRNETENNTIERFAHYGMLLDTEAFPGPTTLVEDALSSSDLEAAAQLTAWYGKGRSQARVKVRCRASDSSSSIIEVAPLQPSGARMLNSNC